MSFENTNMLPFKELTPEQRFEIIEVWINTKQVEIYSRLYSSWIAINVEAIAEYSILRVKKIHTVLPSIDWDDVSDTFNWLARDESGKSFLFENSPVIHIDSPYWKVNVGNFVSATIFSSFKPGNVAWRDSLVKRPGN